MGPQPSCALRVPAAWRRPTRPGRPIARRAASALSLLAIWLLASACGSASEPERVPTRPRDVLLITIDTARADRFSYTGATSPGTPRVDALAAQGAGFLQAISPAPLTLPAHASLLTGRLPPAHGVRDNGSFRLPDSETTLAERLAAAGFTTGAFVGAGVLDARYGLDQGFATYDDQMPEPADSEFLYYAERTGEQVVGSAMRWLDARVSGPVFAWVHLFDPHVPYRPPEPERSRFASSYDGEIAYADRMVGKLLDHWDARRGLDRTLVVVTSDHGEALGEHEEATHGVLVHDATLRVPLVIRGPGLHVDKSIPDAVHLIDVMPTILSLLGLEAPEGMQGRDLSPLLRGGSVTWNPASGYAESLYAELHHECAPLHALREAGFKLVRGSAVELYDLRTDPRELHDVAQSEPERAADMSRELEQLESRIGGGAGEALPIDEATRKALESLGYAASRSATPARPSRDPREALRSMKRMADADRMALHGDVAGAVAAYREVLKVEPGSVDARIRLAQILIAHERGAEAVEPLRQAVALDPEEPYLVQKLGVTLERLGRHSEALSCYDEGLARHPGARALRDGRWRCLNQLGRGAELLAETQRAIALDPSDGMARYARALACCGQGSIEDYVAALERELAQLPRDPVLQAALAKARAEAQGR